MKDIKQIYVHLKMKNKSYNVGILADIRGKIYFEYDTKFLKTGFELSLFKLPLKSGARENKDSEFNSIFGLFHDSFLNPFSENSLEALLNLNEKNSIGSLQYSKTKKIIDEKSEPFYETVILSEIQQSSEEKKLLIQVDKRKSNILYNKEILKEDYRYWMMKIPALNSPSYIANLEYAYSLMAKKAGLEIPNSYLFRTDTQEVYYAIQRFDRDAKELFHIHTLAGLLHRDARLHSLDYDDFLSVTLAITKNIKDVDKAFRLVCFIILSHSKNYNENSIAFLMNNKGDWHLAPATNLIFAYGDSGKYSIKIMGERSWVKMEHLIKLAKAHDIKNSMKVLEEVSKAVASWMSFATIANVPREEALKIDTILNRINQK